MDNVMALFRALSDRNRLRVVSALLDYEELCACQLIELMQVTGATVSRHMNVLIVSGVVSSRKEGRWVYYRLRRDQAWFLGLIQWIEIQLKNDPYLASDAKMLAEITACEPEEICRRQRGAHVGPIVN